MMMWFFLSRYRVRCRHKFLSSPGGHARRDTFAVGMLENGKTLQEVADALGNTLEVTERHYNPWSKTRQKKLDEAVRASWKNDPLLKILDDQEKLSKAKAPARVM